VYPASNEAVESCMNEHEINVIKRIRKGDVNSFEQIVDKFKSRAYMLCLKILKNEEDAEDALQEAFIKTFKAIMEGQFEERSKFSTYFYRIVYNTSIDHYKKHKTRNYDLLRLDAPVPYNDTSGEDTAFKDYVLEIDKSKYGYEDIYKIDKKAAENEIQQIVNTYIEHLPEKYSVILTMFFLNDLTHDEISKILNLPLGTVKNRIFRAKEKLKEILLKVYPLEEIVEYV
jgi:RNA polymerase sigma-70 factor (ECF subfamily)